MAGFIVLEPLRQSHGIVAGIVPVTTTFFLIASIYANPDETMNNDTYGYDAVSFPALADVAEVFCRHAFAP